MKIRYIIPVLIACLACFLFGRYSQKGSSTLVPDTIVIVDTICDSIPYPVIETVVQEVPELFSVYITLQGDTVREPVYIPVPITQKEYKTDDYRLSISGYNPNLDYIEVYRKTEQINVPAKRFGIGIIGGFGIGKHGLSHYIGMGGFYRIW